MACNSRVLWPTIQHEALEHGEAIEEAGGDDGVNGDITDLQSVSVLIITQEKRLLSIRQISILYLSFLHCY